MWIYYLQFTTQQKNLQENVEINITSVKNRMGWSPFGNLSLEKLIKIGV